MSGHDPQAEAGAAPGPSSPHLIALDTDLQ